MSTKNTYRLINPYIEGSARTIVQSRNSFNAGKKIYNNISSFFSNNVDNFFMSIQNVQTGGLSHFMTREKRDNNGVVKYKLTKFEKDFDDAFARVLVKTVDKINKQSGGKKKYKFPDSDSSSSDSDSDDEYRYPLQPISRFTYFVLPYHTLMPLNMNIVDTGCVYVPMFNFPVNPSLEIRFDLYYQRDLII